MAELATPSDRIVGRAIGRYEVLHLLATGGMGAVYVGRTAGVGEFERLVAIKMLHPHLAHDAELVRMFLDEARLAARIRHSNVVATLDVCRTSDGHFLVMEYLDGADLGKLLGAALHRRARLPVPVVLRIVVDALAGLGAAHGLADARGERLELVHRDVSPQNLLVGVDGMARLADFGVANARNRAATTEAGHFKGKLAYASPEHAGLGSVDQRSDLFGMGIVLWEALAGRALFRAATQEGTIRRVLHETIAPVSSVHPDLAPLDAVVARALARPAEERFQSAREMSDAIEHAAAEVGGLASSRTVGEVVRDLAREKLAQERAAIERALMTRSRTDAGSGTEVSRGPSGRDLGANARSWRPLPAPPPTFVGRADDLARVGRLFVKTRVVVVTGPAGGGKSAFVRAVVATSAGARETRSYQCTAEARSFDAMESMLGLEPLATSDADRAAVLARQLDARELVLAIEDVHLLSAPERERLLQVAAILKRATVLFTSREPLELSRIVPGAVYVELAPLGAEEARQLVADLLDRRGARGDVEAIVRAAAGNPLWCSLLAGAGHLSDQLASLIADLDPPAMAALQQLALFRRPVPGEWIGGRREVNVLASRYLCASVGHSSVEMHDVVRAAVAGSLSRERTAEIHVAHARRWAEAGDQAEQFHHLVASGDLVALRDGLAGGLDDWLVPRAWLPNIRTFIAKLDAAGIEPGPRLRYREASELAYAGRVAEARRVLDRAGAASTSDVLLECVARIAIVYAERGSADERDRLLERAAAARRREPQRFSGEWSRLVVSAIWDLSARGERRRAVALCRQALADPSLREGDRAKLLRTAADLTLDAPTGHRELDEAESLLAEIGSPYLSALNDVVRARLYLEQGEVARARVVYERAWPVIAQQDQTVTLGIYGRGLGPRFAGATGAIEEAIAETRRWVDERPKEQQVAQRSWAHAVMCLAAREADHPELCRRTARVVLRTPSHERHRYDVAEALLALAAARAAGDRPERALRATVAALEEARRGGFAFVAAPAFGLLAEVLAGAGRYDEAECAAELAVRGAMAMDLPRVRVRALVLLGRLALRNGIAERALELADEAAEIARASGQKWEHARAAAVAGWASFVLGREADARAWLARAEPDRFEAARTAAAGLASLALASAGRDASPYPWWVPPALTAVDLEIDVEGLRAIVDGSRVVDFAAQPLLAKILCAVAAEPEVKWDKGTLFERVWELPYRGQARDAAIYKAVARVAKALDPDAPHRFIAWQDGALVLKDRSVRIRGR